MATAEGDAWGWFVLGTCFGAGTHEPLKRRRRICSPGDLMRSPGAALARTPPPARTPTHTTRDVGGPHGPELPRGTVRGGATELFACLAEHEALVARRKEPDE